jgi:hypothetical protein
MIQLCRKKIALHCWKLICKLAIICFYLHKAFQVQLLLSSLRTLIAETIKLFSIGRCFCQRAFRWTNYFTYWTCSLHWGRWLFLLHYVDLSIVVFLKELLIRHLDEHVVINLVRTASWSSCYSIVNLWNVILWFLDWLLYYLRLRDTRSSKTHSCYGRNILCSLVNNLCFLHLFIRTELGLKILSKFLLRRLPLRTYATMYLTEPTFTLLNLERMSVCWMHSIQIVASLRNIWHRDYKVYRSWDHWRHSIILTLRLRLQLHYVLRRLVWSLYLPFFKSI